MEGLQMSENQEPESLRDVTKAIHLVWEPEKGTEGSSIKNGSYCTDWFHQPFCMDSFHRGTSKTREEWRYEFAKAAMIARLIGDANDNMFTWKQVAEHSCEAANALLAELERTEKV
jgi:hypothetical protein